MKRFFCYLFILISCFMLVSCSCSNCKKDNNNDDDQNQNNNNNNNNNQNEPSIKDDFECISIAEAIEKARAAGSQGTSEKYYVYGKITAIESHMYGSMTITDETGSIYVYGVYSKDEQTRYDALEEKPVVGDEVVLYGKLKTYNDEPEMDRGYLQAMKHVDVQIDASDYKESTIANARNAEVGSKVKLTGVVAKITYAFGYAPNGFYLVDNTGSIYVYGKDSAASVKEGNTVTVIGEKTYYVLETEQSFAQKHGYKGSCQIQNVQVLENDKQVSEFDKSWIEESTVKDIIETPITENITSDIFKVNAIIKKQVNPGFVNYYIDDLDGVTGSYVYTSCNGSDFEWLDEFDGKICTVYLSAINAKSTAAGCIYRFIPVEVKYENYTFDQTKGAEFALDYYAVDQFLSEYQSDPALELVTSVSNELIGLENVQVSYTSANENIVYFEEVNGSLVLHTKECGEVNITITASYKGVTKAATVKIKVSEAPHYDTISVAEAIAKEDGTEVYLKGIVVSSLVNQMGFYLSDETGIIAVVGNEADIALLSSGDEVIIKGTKTHRIKEDYTGAGQINIDGAEILVNNYGNHEYPTNFFDDTKTLAELYAFDHNEDHSTEVYVVNAIVEVVNAQYYTSIKIKSVDGKTSMSLYSSSANQYEFLKQYAGKEVTLELALCNWNGKNYYAGCVISVTYDGVKTVNTLNFDE